MKLRLYGINTPEVRGVSKKEGKRVRDHVRELILNKEVVLKTHKDKTGKYGRWLADIYFQMGAEQVHLNQYLIDNKMAIPFMV